MAFNKELPEWKAAGIEPPLTKRNEGWKPGEKPPADWLNWTQNRTYEALKELQEKAAEITSIQSLSVKSDVRVGTTENITLSGTQTINGVAVIAEDRILVKNQSTGSQNGIYVVKAGAWARAADADTSAKLANGIEVFVREGTVGRQTLWRMTNTGTVILGSTALTFQQTEASLVSPALTGIPTAPTATVGSNNAQIATTAYVDSVVATSPAATPLNLGYGHQIVTVPRNTPYNLLNITGRTLINLLGRAGNMEDISLWPLSNVTCAADTINYTTGKQSMKVTASGASSTDHYAVCNSWGCKANSYYVAIAKTKPNTGRSGLRLATFTSGGVLVQNPASPLVSDTTKFTMIVAKVATGATETITNIQVRAHIYDSAGNLSYIPAGIAENANFDEIRIFEVTAAEYSAIDSMSASQIATKYPYVDDMKSIVNPYVIKSGENLLPPFSDGWYPTAASGSPTMTALSPYSAQLTADGDAQAIAIVIPIVPNQTYTVSVGSGTKIGVNTGDINKAFINAFGGYSVGSKTFTTDANAVYLTVLLSNDTAGAGTFTFSNPMLNIRTTALPFKPRADDYLFFPNVQLASNPENTIYDTLDHRDGKYWKLSRFKTMDLDGSREWSFQASNTGYKTVTSVIGTNYIADTGQAAKYDGKILQRLNYGIPTTGPDLQVLGHPNGIIHLTIANTDSGWGEGYNPSNAEIQAYFYGWKMYAFDTGNSVNPYTGTGTKGWVKIRTTASPTNVLPTTASNDTGWTPYKLQYQLATPTTEEIAVEGDITLHEGLNQIEVGNGMIVRERAKVGGNTTDIPNSGFSYIGVDGVLLPGGASETKYRIKQIIAVYKNEKPDSQWTIDNSGVSNAYGKSRAYTTNYDPKAAYTVTYIAELYSLTSNNQSIQGEYASNLKTVVDTLATNQADVATRVGVLENTKAQKVQPQWITPTLLSGWVNFGGLYSSAGYYKNEFGVVSLRGLIKSGTATNGTVLFILPTGYRPTGKMLLSCYSNGAFGGLVIDTDGLVMIDSGSNVSLSLEDISFLAKQ